jgi:hypothetical protein
MAASVIASNFKMKKEFWRSPERVEGSGGAACWGLDLVPALPV